MILQSRFEDAADAAALIGRGPEALQSQFRSGYGMALNLLHSRSLDEARAFIQRSFDNYLGGWGGRRCHCCSYLRCLPWLPKPGCRRRQRKHGCAGW